MPTLLLPPCHTDDATRLWRAAIAAGWRTERVASLRFVPTLQERDVAVYGEPIFASVVTERLRLALLEPPLSWLAHLPYTFRKREVTATSLAEARKVTTRAFIKPADDKCFPAQVYDSGQDLPPAEALPDSLPVLLSEPVTWETEFRCFVRDGQVRTLSVYLRQGRSAEAEDGGAWPATDHEIEEARHFGQQVLDRAGGDLPASVVLDIGVIASRGWAVVEANPSWASGIYGGVPADVLPVFARACVPWETLTAADPGSVPGPAEESA